MKEFTRAVKFVCFSVSAGLIEIGSFALFNELLHWPNWLSYMTALLLSVLWNFTLNRKFTFKSAANVPIAMLKVAAYYAVFTPLSSWLEDVYTMQWGWNEYLATSANMALNLVTEFLYQRFFVFGKSLDTQENNKKNMTKGRRLCHIELKCQGRFSPVLFYVLRATTLTQSFRGTVSTNSHAGLARKAASTAC